MNLLFQEQLPKDFDPGSRVWIYQSDRLFSLPEALEIEELLGGFIRAWASHGQQVKGYGNLFFGQFIVLMADESGAGVSGCSTDSSVRFIAQLEERFRVHFFDRLLLAFLVKERVQLLPMAQVPHALANNFINGDTIYFNNTVLTKKELETGWMMPLKNSWLSKKFGSLQDLS